ncbi:MAG: DUF1501 domain-containing protein [Verrucomicrobiales bacterium]
MTCPRFDPSPPASRRQWLGRFGFGLGGAALASLLGRSAADLPPETATGVRAFNTLPHFRPRARRVLVLFMSGGFSQFESFEHKPVLTERFGQPLPESLLRGRAPLGMSKNQAVFQLTASRFAFARHGRSGMPFSDRFPHLARHADKLCFLRAVVSDAVNHDPAMTFMQTGAPLPGRPSLGAWLSYGLGSENRNLPAFVVLMSRRHVDQPLSTRLWDSGFLPAQHQGVLFRPSKDPVLYLNNPPGLPPALQRASLDRLAEVHAVESRRRRGEEAIEARIAQYELAFRMQMAVPEVTDLSQEPAAVRQRYGPMLDQKGSFAFNALLARRLLERDVRLVQLYHPGWDHHGNLPVQFEGNAAEIDQPMAALLSDLDERGLLDDTLVVFATEFGRTCYSQGTGPRPDRFGREHHRDAFTCWLAGAGVKPGFSHGETDRFGFHVVRDKVHVHDLHATILHLLGIDHQRLTYRFQGRDFRLTDVFGHVVTPILA